VSAEDTPLDLGIDFDIKSPEDAIVPRSFNRVDFISDDAVQKTSETKILDGEVYFYMNIPKDVASYFPRFIEARNTGVYTSLVMGRVNGTPLTNLLITHCLGSRHILELMSALKDIHTSKDAKELAKTQQINHYINYASKLRSRFMKHRDLYTQLYGEAKSSDMFKKISAALDEFEQNDRAIKSYCIHGDPVFSNVLDSNGRIILLDMRGKVGKTLTLQGDAHYDLAKVLQCLYGYDFVLQGGDVRKEDEEYLANLRVKYFDFVSEHYAAKKLDVLWVTASHYFSLIPLHSEKSKQERYLRLCSKVLADIEKVS